MVSLEKLSSMSVREEKIGELSTGFGGLVCQLKNSTYDKRHNNLWKLMKITNSSKIPDSHTINIEIVIQ